MNPTLTNGQTDIFWRDIQEDDSIFQKENENRAILILTDVTTSPTLPKVSRADFVKIENNQDRCCGEIVQFYAFLT